MAYLKYHVWKAMIPKELQSAFEPLTKAMDNWEAEIFAYFDYRVTNAYTESLNSLIRVINRLALKLQAWVILQAVERRTGEGCPHFQLKEHPGFNTYLMTISSDRGVLDVPSIQRGLSYELHGSDLIKSLLQKLSVITQSDLEDIEHKFVTYSDSNTSDSDSDQVEKIALKSGQMGVRSFSQRNHLLEIIYHELYKGRWRHIPIVSFAQSLLRSDDPFILLQGPLPAVDADEWAIDYELDKFSGNKKMILERMLPHIHVGLADDEIVISAVLHTYSWSVDLEVFFGMVLRDKGCELFPAPTHETTTMNGRTFALFDEDRFDPLDDTSPVLEMTYKAGGIGEFNNQSMLCYPSTIITSLLGWYPSENNPFVWLEDGEPVMRFEYVHGKVRDITQDQLHRQPFMQRWVCSKKALEKAETMMEITISPVYYANSRKSRY